jgi:prolyl 4-hydroxylase
MGTSISFFEKNGYLEVPNTLPHGACNKLTQHLFRLKNSGSLKADTQCPDSLSVYNDELLSKLLPFYAPFISKLSGKELLPTYCYARVYQKGTELKRHKDRKACEISVTLTLGYSGIRPWPIKFMSEGKEVTLHMDSGSLCVYKGCDLEHWREPLKDEWQVQVFLHYVDKNGAYSIESAKEKNKYIARKKTLRSNISLNTTYRTGITLSTKPFIHIIDNFVADKEIAEVLKHGFNNTKDAVVVSPDPKVSARGGVISATRSGKHAWICTDSSKIINALAVRMSNLVGVPLQNAGSIQLLHYDVGQQYKPHFDSWDETTERGKSCLKERGQRVLTCLFYLNNVEEGGGTSFPKLNLEIEAKKGRLLVFHNCHPNTSNRHIDSKHAGMPVIKGFKWAGTLWFSDMRHKDTK